MMRMRVFLIATSYFFVSSCYAQTEATVVKVYAYEREVSPGVPGGRGSSASGPQLRNRYSIYLETRDPTVVVDGVWMNGRYHDVETAVRKGPIILSGPVVVEANDKNTLVPPTTNPVIEILVKDSVKDRMPTDDLNRLFKNNVAVIRLTDKGRTISVPVAKFQKKDPIYLQ